jgi:hypothetical protein
MAGSTDHSQLEMVSWFPNMLQGGSYAYGIPALRGSIRGRVQSVAISVGFRGQIRFKGLKVKSDSRVLRSIQIQGFQGQFKFKGFKANSDSRVSRSNQIQGFEGQRLGGENMHVDFHFQGWLIYQTSSFEMLHSGPRIVCRNFSVILEFKSSQIQGFQGQF